MTLASIFPVPFDWNLCYIKESRVIASVKDGADAGSAFTDKCEAQFSRSQSNGADE